MLSTVVCVYSLIIGFCLILDILLILCLVQLKFIMEERGETPDEIRKEEEEDEIMKKSWAALMVEFTQDTTLHGIRFVTGDSKFIIRR